MVVSALVAGAGATSIFGGFAPFPNTIATALLAYQSEAIGFGFGIKFQYSKRLIGAMTNEEFNGLTPNTIGNIVEAHNTELIQRMKDEMPKWLDIQQSYIEAGVQVEIAKATRTPSAWAEIINAFVGASTTEVEAQITDFFDGSNESLQTLTLLSPVLALMALLGREAGGGGEDTPPEEETEVFKLIFTTSRWQIYLNTDTRGTHKASQLIEAHQTLNLRCNEIADLITSSLQQKVILEEQPFEQYGAQKVVQNFVDIKNLQILITQLNSFHTTLCPLPPEAPAEEP